MRSQNLSWRNARRHKFAWRGPSVVVVQRVHVCTKPHEKSASVCVNSVASFFFFLSFWNQGLCPFKIIPLILSKANQVDGTREEDLWGKRSGQAKLGFLAGNRSGVLTRAAAAGRDQVLRSQHLQTLGHGSVIAYFFVVYTKETQVWYSHILLCCSLLLKGPFPEFVYYFHIFYKYSYDFICPWFIYFHKNSFLMKTAKIWAMTWQNQQNECAPSEDSGQPGHPPSLISLRGALNG